MAADHYDPQDATIITPSLGRRFSGINATMEALLPVMRKQVPIACCGTHLSEKTPRVKLMDWLNSSQRKGWRIWHARRNNDMLVGLFLRHILRRKLIMLWTSAAQRRHSWITRFCYHRMDHVIATTGKAAGFLDCEAEISHHGVDAGVYQPPEDRASVRAELGLRERPTLGVFGRVRPQKGSCDLVSALCEILPQHPRWQVVFVGAITPQFVGYQKDLVAQLEKAGIADRVKFTGFLKDFSELPRWYQAIDVVGCVSRVEGFGVTCLEGMASGAPALVTAAGAWHEIVTEGRDGWHALANNPDDLARALRLALSRSDEDLRQMGAAARRTILDRFTIEHESARIIDVYRRLLRDYGEELTEFTEAPTARSAA